MSRYSASVEIALTTPELAMPPLQSAMPMRSFRSVATADHGRKMIQASTRATKRLGRAIWMKWSEYHRRRLAETKMHCFKLLGQRVVVRTLDRQITELKVRAAILNRFSQIGTPVTVRIAQ